MFPCLQVKRDFTKAFYNFNLAAHQGELIFILRTGNLTDVVFCVQATRWLCTTWR